MTIIYNCNIEYPAEISRAPCSYVAHSKAFNCSINEAIEFIQSNFRVQKVIKGPYDYWKNYPVVINANKVDVFDKMYLPSKEYNGEIIFHEEGITVGKFISKNCEKGTWILGMRSHVICIKDGVVF